MLSRFLGLLEVRHAHAQRSTWLEKAADKQAQTGSFVFVSPLASFLPLGRVNAQTVLRGLSGLMQVTLSEPLFTAVGYFLVTPL